MIRLKHRFSKKNEGDARNICTCYPRGEDTVTSWANRGSPAGRRGGLRARLLGIPVGLRYLGLCSRALFLSPHFREALTGLCPGKGFFEGGGSVVL